MKITRIILFFVYIIVATLLSMYLNDVLFYMVASFHTGWLFSSIFIRLLVILLFALGLREIFSISTKLGRLKFVYIFLIALLPGFLLSFALSPIYQYDYGNFGALQPFGDPAVLNEGTENKSFLLDQEYNLIAFFTTDCPHCKLACQRISATTNGDEKLSVNLFFPGNEVDTKRFLTENNGLKFDYHLTADNVFMNFAGFAFPSIFLVDKTGKTILHWTGDELNYNALDYLSSLEH